MQRASIAGVFVGGRSTRMGGRPKGLLVTPSGETIVARWCRTFEAIGVRPVLVGASAPYAGLGLETVSDAPAIEGPVAGLVALLERAGEGVAYAVACDMPYVSEPLVRRLRDAPFAPVVAARRAGKWEPFFARWDAPSTIALVRGYAAGGGRALQSLFAEAGAAELALSEEEQRELRDWDAPEDIGPR